MIRYVWRDNVHIALDTLRTHKVRTGLTVLGIVIGVTSVISVAAIVQGLNRFISDRVEALGSKTYFLSRIPFAQFGRMPEHIRKRRYLEFGYRHQLEAACPSIKVFTPFATRPSPGENFAESQPNEIRYASERVERILIRGAEPEHAEAIPLFAVSQGRFITAFDEEHSREVVVVGDAIAAALFPGLDPIGKIVRVNGKLMEVIGVLEQDPGMFGGPGLDQVAVMPLSTFRKHNPEIREVFFAFIVADHAATSAAVNEVVEAMRRIRRVRQNEENDFELISPDFMTNLWNQLTGALVVLTGAISSVGLLIGGIGVMNIMLISVTERTAEIGVRKAVGARRTDIRVQFLLEAMALSVAGGAIGVALGALIAFLVRTFVPSVPAALSYFWVALGVLISMGVGLFFGYYPASRAANLDPVTCLRYE